MTSFLNLTYPNLPVRSICSSAMDSNGFSCTFSVYCSKKSFNNTVSLLIVSGVSLMVRCFGDIGALMLAFGEYNGP